jgi:hypothetical protein
MRAMRDAYRVRATRNPSDVAVLHAVPTHPRGATGFKRIPRAALGTIMKLVLLTAIACVLGVAAVLFVLMFRRNESILGLAGLTLATCGGFVALVYAELGED